LYTRILHWMEKPDTWRRTAALFLASQILSLFGSSLVQYALLWYVTLNTGSGVMMTIYILAGFLPTFLLSPLAGVWADRYNRRILIILADGAIALTTLALALLFSAGHELLWLVFLAAAIRAMGTAVQHPAVGAILPQIVPQDRLMRVNGIFGSFQSVIGLGAPVLSAVLMSTSPLSTVFYIDVVTAALAIILLAFFIPITRHRNADGPENSSHLQEIIAGFRYIGSHRYLIPLFVFTSGILILVGPAAFLTPLQIARSYGEEVWRLSAIEVAFSLGMAAGGGLLAIWGGFKNRVHTLVLSTLLMGTCTLWLGFTPVFALYIAAMVLFGIALAMYNTPTAVLLQEHVEEQFLGRVFSVYSMLFSSLMPLSMLIFGPLAELMSIELQLIITGSAMLLIGLTMPLSRQLIAAGQPPEAPVQTEPEDTAP
jgi:DHA3 family macrolide efflux protein-like MFS transporter